MQDLDISNLKAAAQDFRYLLNRKYPRTNSLELVGNKYNLDSKHRHLLHRAIYSDEIAKIRKTKLISCKKLYNKVIGIDGHNVIITLESSLKGIPIIKCDDGVIKNIAGVSGKYKITDNTYKTISLLTNFFKNTKIKQLDFYFDSPISYSGELAKLVQKNLSEHNLSCQAMAIKVPEKKLINYPIVATSDSGLIDKSDTIIDMAGCIIKKENFPIINLE